jgi:hypothetical protein
VAMADRRRNSGLQRQSSREEMAFYRGEFIVEKGSRRSSTGGPRHGHGMAARGVATCSGERPMEQGGGAIRWVGERRVAPARTLTSVTHRSQGAADRPLVAGMHVRRGTAAGKHGAPATSRAGAFQGECKFGLA